MKLSDARLVITGAGGGLGRTVALELLRAGGRVAAIDVSAARLRELRREAGDLADRLVLETIDVTDEPALTAAVAAAAERWGGVNGAIHCAGILRDGLLVDTREGGVRRFPLASWRQVIDLNLTAAFLLTREVAARMIEDGTRDGVVIHLSSLSRKGNLGQGNYAASKAGLDAAMRTWALELARHGIRVASIAPGVVDTPFLQGIQPAALERLIAEIPLARPAVPQEIWLAVRFVLECDYYSGRVLEVDGAAEMPVVEETVAPRRSA